MNMLVKKGNREIYDVALTDDDGDLLTDLASASAVKFHVKETAETATIKINKSIGSGIEINTPAIGYVRITFYPADTSSLDVKEYVMGLQVEYSSTNHKEVDLRVKGEVTDVFEIEQDVVNS